MSSAETLPAHQLPATGQLLFYRRPEALTADRHGSLRLKREGDFGFARATNSVAICVSEFVHVMRFYPIVFSGATPYPVAVLGLDQQNLFVGADALWRAEHYIPAYMRRYPFAFIAHPDGQQFILGIDRACERLTEDGAALPLFEDGKPAAITQEALRLCSAFQTDHGLTQTFAAALVEQGLLVDNQAQAKLPDGRQMNLQGFKVIDRAKFAGLGDSVIVDWHKKGWLALVHYQLASLDRFQILLELQGAAKPDGQSA
jgi:hypothetical protein